MLPQPNYLLQERSDPNKTARNNILQNALRLKKKKELKNLNLKGVFFNPFLKILTARQNGFAYFFPDSVAIHWME